jgi:hypothetical protein
VSYLTDNYGSFGPSSMDPEQLRMSLIRSKLQPVAPMGTTINAQPIVPTPVQTVPIGGGVPTNVVASPGGPATDPNAAPYRLDRGAVSPPMPTVAPPPPALPSQWPPPASAPPMALPQASPSGLTLNSTPAQGWGGTVGLPAPDDTPSKSFDKGVDWNKMTSGLEDVAKGLKPKSTDSKATEIIPSQSQMPQTNPLAYQLMSQLMANSRMKGLTLTG